MSLGAPCIKSWTVLCRGDGRVIGSSEKRGRKSVHWVCGPEEVLRHRPFLFSLFPGCHEMIRPLPYAPTMTGWAPTNPRRWVGRQSWIETSETVMRINISAISGISSQVVCHSNEELKENLRNSNQAPSNREGWEIRNLKQPRSFSQIPGAARLQSFGRRL